MNKKLSLDLFTNYILIDHEPDLSSFKTKAELFASGEIKKIKYQCIKILEPQDIYSQPISQLKLYLIDD